MAYTPTGPFVNGGAPGISAPFLNNMENYLQLLRTADVNITANGAGLLTALALAINTPPVTITGNTAGTATLYQVLQGTVKLAVLSMNGYRNNTGTEQVIYFPVPYSNKAVVITGATQSLHSYYGGNQQNNTIRCFTGLVAGGGSSSIQSNINQYSIGIFTNNFDAIGLGTSQSTTYNDIMVIIGL